MKRAVRAAGYIAISGLVTLGGLGACSSDDSNPVVGGGQDSGAPGADAGADVIGVVTPPADSGGADTGSTGGGDTGVADAGVDSGAPDDSGQDATTPVDGAGGGDAGAADAADSAVGPSFCQAQVGLAFCDDFDLAGSLSLDGGAATAWSQVVSNGTEVAISSAQAKKAPNSLLVALPNGPLPDGGGNTDQSAKVVKMITPANGVTQAIYEFDMYIDTVPLANVGGFATDFQFDDTAGGSDQFGFRIGVFANTSGFDHAELQHNHPVLGGPDDIISSIPITAHAWNHVKMVVAFSALANDAGDSVAFQLYIDDSATAAVDQSYPAPFTKAAFARFAAGMVYSFDGTNKDWGIYYDNFTLKLQ